MFFEMGRLSVYLGHHYSAGEVPFYSRGGNTVDFRAGGRCLTATWQGQPEEDEEEPASGSQEEPEEEQLPEELPDGMCDQLEAPREGEERVWRRCVIVDAIWDMPGALHPPLTPLLGDDDPR